MTEKSTRNNLFKGSLFVALGASSYGMLATFVKLAYRQGFSTAEITLSQFGVGFIVLFILNLFRKPRTAKGTDVVTTKSTLKLIIAGTAMGLTSIFYYMAVRYIPVSIAIVLLMQTVWMGAVAEMILLKKKPDAAKLFSIVIILTGTVLATNLLKNSATINWTGICWGMLAALTYTGSMYASNTIEPGLAPEKRSMYMVLGGLIIIACIFRASLNQTFAYKIFLNWGLVLSLFGTVLPPLLFTRGMPLTGMGLGAIIASIEIPVSVFMANLVLGEPVNPTQLAGIMLILFAVVLINVPQKTKQ